MSYKCFFISFLEGPPPSSIPGSKGSWQQGHGPLPLVPCACLGNECCTAKPEGLWRNLGSFSPVFFPSLNATGTKHTVKPLPTARLFHPGSAGCSFGGGGGGGGGGGRRLMGGTIW